MTIFSKNWIIRNKLSTLLVYKIQDTRYKIQDECRKIYSSFTIGFTILSWYCRYCWFFFWWIIYEIANSCWTSSFCKHDENHGIWETCNNCAVSWNNIGGYCTYCILWNYNESWCESNRIFSAWISPWTYYMLWRKHIIEFRSCNSYWFN